MNLVPEFHGQWTTARGQTYHQFIIDKHEHWLLDEDNALIVALFSDDCKWWITPANDEIDFDPVGPFPTPETAAIAAMMMSK